MTTAATPHFATCEDAIAVAYEAHDLGQAAIAAKAMSVAIRASKGNAALLRRCAAAMAWLFPTDPRNHSN